MTLSQQLKKPVRSSYQHKISVLKKELIMWNVGLAHVEIPKKILPKNEVQCLIATSEVSRKIIYFTRLQFNSEELFPFLKASVLEKLKSRDHSENYLLRRITQTPIHDLILTIICV